MNEYLLFKLAHVIAFVYWLGGDLGTFYASRYVIRTDIGVEARSTALKIMMGCDQGPKICMPLILATGLAMTQEAGLIMLPEWVPPVVWLVCLVWVLNVIYLYYSQNQVLKETITKIDFYCRIVVAVSVASVAIAGLNDSTFIKDEWLCYKMLVFAGLVVSGLMIRIQLKPFTPAFVRLVTEGASEEVNSTLSRSVQRASVFVYSIWIGLLVCAALGLHLI